MKFFLASYPRSGNTFFRIVLLCCYGLDSVPFNQSRQRKQDPVYIETPVIKTHRLPHLLDPKDPTIPAVYVVRDGRDAMISMAHQRVDFRKNSHSYYDNLRGIICNPKRKHKFGNWSTNVREWNKKADIIIRYEDLISNPIETVELIRSVVDLPDLITENIPTFEQLKTGQFKEITDSISLSNTKNKPWKLERFFRRGIPGAWKDEMPDDLHELFWQNHKDMMVEFGYTEGLI
ncbi:sulfotransferase domain-containing protein [Gammaproteobacteria bacterium]|nr:sulfotransferase domain-containing protein [Gammaproteobacteria bacterium]